jgi:hypothetical protein
MSNKSKIRLRIFILIVCTMVIAWIGLANLFHLGPFNFLVNTARVLAVPVFASIYHDDLKTVKETAESYLIGDKELLSLPPSESWKNIETEVPGFRLLGYSEGSGAHLDIPFVYEKTDSPELVEFREKYFLDRIADGPGGEYNAMLRLGNWLGTRWDHGVDPVPGGPMVCSPARVIAAGENGSRFWCEIAGRTAIKAATALGWTARLLTASRDGYTWEHAVAEFWSNQFNKWFVIDTDFNCVYEHEGVPLSGFELCHQGEQLQKKGLLVVRKIAPAKKSLPTTDLIPFYSYVHIDMRSDWCSRKLPKGSPAGGDFSTWWTSRPYLHHLLTAKRRVDDPDLFDWKVNWVAIYALNAKMASGGLISIEIGLVGYSPVFKAFEVSLDGGGWQRVEQGEYVVNAGVGEHVLRARLVIVAGYAGPESKVGFQVVPAGQEFSIRKSGSFTMT